MSVLAGEGILKQFEFEIVWKELLRCEHSQGSFCLDFPMGQPCVVLPDESTWARVAPEWARQLWPQLHKELEAWCATDNFRLSVERNASVHV